MPQLNNKDDSARGSITLVICFVIIIALCALTYCITNKIKQDPVLKKKYARWLKLFSFKTQARKYISDEESVGSFRKKKRSSLSMSESQEIRVLVPAGTASDMPEEKIGVKQVQKGPSDNKGFIKEFSIQDDLNHASYDVKEKRPPAINNSPYNKSKTIGKENLIHLSDQKEKQSNKTSIFTVKLEEDAKIHLSGQFGLQEFDDSVKPAQSNECDAQQGKDDEAKQCPDTSIKEEESSQQVPKYLPEQGHINQDSDSLDHKLKQRATLVRGTTQEGVKLINKLNLQKVASETKVHGAATKSVKGGLDVDSLGSGLNLEANKLAAAEDKKRRQSVLNLSLVFYDVNSQAAKTQRNCKNSSLEEQSVINENCDSEDSYSDDYEKEGAPGKIIYEQVSSEEDPNSQSFHKIETQIEPRRPSITWNKLSKVLLDPSKMKELQDETEIKQQQALILAKQIFLSYDQNNNGNIDLDEAKRIFIQYLKENGSQVSDEEVNLWFQQAQVQGKITQEEAAKFVLKYFFS